MSGSLVGVSLTHFDILEELGAGGMGVVYKARDRKLDRTVALKVLQEARTGSPGHTLRFIQEAKAASALNHPNIVTVYEIEKTPDGRDFIAMEFVEGETVRALMRGPVAMETIADIVRQTAQALSATHARGIVHRDIKPENIVLRQDGYIKVLDFGLASLPPEGASPFDTRVTEPGTILGTVAYMSPEQARGEPAGAAADVFALGVLFYELATRKHPFEASTGLAMLGAIQNCAPLPPRRLDPRIPQELEELIMQMLDRDPARRPGASAVAERLSAAGRKATDVPAAQPGRVFVGREAERAELLRALDSAAAGSGSCVLLSGEPGIGKTTLVEEFLAEATGRGARVGRGRCSERLGASEGFLPLLEALESLLRGPEGAEAARTMRTLAPSWYVQLFSPSRDSSVGALEEEWRNPPVDRLKRELVSLFEELSRQCLLILFLDDLHWADLSTVDVLSHVALRCAAMPLLVLGTYRESDMLLAKHPFLRVKLDLLSRGIARELSLGFLTVEDVARYISLSFPRHRFPKGLAELILGRTEGNPLFMADLVRDLRDEGILRENAADECWCMECSLEEIEGRLPQSVRSLIQRKIDRLSDSDRKLLTAAAVQGHEFDTAVVATASRLDAADVEERLHELETAHALVQECGEREMPDGTFSIRYQFVHVLYQNAFNDLLRPTRRSALSGAVADALADFHRDKLTGIAAKLALLYEAARNPLRAVEFCVIAARHAAEISAHREAIAIGRRGLELLRRLPESPERSRAETGLYLAFGPAMVMSRGYADPETERTYNAALEACRQSGARHEIFEALVGLCAFYFFRPRLKTADEITRRLVAVAEEAGVAEMLVWAYTMRASVQSHTGEFAEGLRFAELACEAYATRPEFTHISRAVHDPGCIAFGQAARLQWLGGFPERALARAESCLKLGRESGHAYTLAMTLFFAAWLRQHRDEPAEALQYASEATVLAETRGFVNLMPWCASIHGWASARLGRTADGLSEMSFALDLLERMGAGLILPQFMGTVAETLGETGDAAGGLLLIEKAVESTARTEEHFFDAELLRLRARLELQMSPGETASAEGLLRRAVEVAQGQGAAMYALRAAVDLARLEMRSGVAGDGRALLAGIYAQFVEGFDSPDLKAAAALLA